MVVEEIHDIGTHDYASSDIYFEYICREKYTRVGLLVHLSITW
jgi:hypothetical protein